MNTWLLHSYVVEKQGTYFGNIDANLISSKRLDDGLTAWEHLQKIAREGWELVSVTPITTRDGVTNQLLYTFKIQINKG